MSWAEIKAAINSTLGTSEFKSLDSIIKDNFRLVGSDNLFYLYDGGFTKNDEERMSFSNKYVSCNCDGVANIYVPVSYTDDSGAARFEISVVSSTGEIKNQVTISSGTYTATFPITVVAGEKIRIEVRMAANLSENEYNQLNVGVRSYQIRATLVGGTNRFEAVVEEGV